MGVVEGKAVEVAEIFEKIGQRDDLRQLPDPRRQDAHRIIEAA
jgi:hypothetical protein